MEEKGRYKIHRYTLQGNEKISLNDYIEHICERYDFGFEKIEEALFLMRDKPSDLVKVMVNI